MDGNKNFQLMDMEELSKLISEYMEIGRWDSIKDLKVLVQRRKDDRNF